MWQIECARVCFAIEMNKLVMNDIFASHILHFCKVIHVYISIYYPDSWPELDFAAQMCTHVSCLAHVCGMATKPIDVQMISSTTKRINALALYYILFCFCDRHSFRRSQIANINFGTMKCNRFGAGRQTIKCINALKYTSLWRTTFEIFQIHIIFIDYDKFLQNLFFLILVYLG